MPDFIEIWSYLSQGPLVWLTLTLVAYVAGDALAEAVQRRPYANPVLIAAVLLMRSAAKADDAAARYGNGGVEAGRAAMSGRGMWDALDAGDDPTDTPTDTEGR